ncbi:MAG: helix-turn-helix domain-containing protein [Coriobacteriales bacterium]|jgi:IS30 family transposase|nr:helix-turn-helix domain-containing protein [Coriobacteriales bacterium]
MSKTFKHLTLSERIVIEQMLSVCKTPQEIGNAIGFSRQAVAQEIARSRIEQGPAKTYARHWNGCVFQRRCELRHVCKNASCNRLCKNCRNYNCVACCKSYERDTCPLLSRSPYVCNGCPEFKSCAHIRFVYRAATADLRARDLLAFSRMGPDLTADEIGRITEIARPLLANGQSPAQIWLGQGDTMPCSERSFYRYVHAGYFDDIQALSLPFACRYAPRLPAVGPKRPNLSAEALDGRTYEDFCGLDALEQTNAVEMDCVCGARGSELIILTLLWRPWMFQLMMLLDEHTASAVTGALDNLEDLLGKDFPGVLLADRGCEFADASGIEKALRGTARRCRLYYCDPRRSDQKAKCENNHRLIRRILPKGTQFNGLTAEDMALLTSHVNSMPRASLGGKSPMELATGALPDRLFKGLGITSVPSSKVILKPRLLGLV